MCCNLKASNETAMMIEVFQSPAIIYLVVNVEAILFNVKVNVLKTGNKIS